MMSVPPISSPPAIPQATTDTSRPRNQSDSSTANAGDRSNTTGHQWNWVDDSRPTQSSYTAPGTGLIVDKRV